VRFSEYQVVLFADGAQLVPFSEAKFKFTRSCSAQVKANYSTVQSSADTLRTMITDMPSWAWANHAVVRADSDRAFQQVNWDGNRPVAFRALLQTCSSLSGQSRKSWAHDKQEFAPDMFVTVRPVTKELVRLPNRLGAILVS
jgi:hypothetical protein